MSYTPSCICGSNASQYCSKKQGGGVLGVMAPGASYMTNVIGVLIGSYYGVVVYRSFYKTFALGPL
jgi:hypothetical protein